MEGVEGDRGVNARALAELFRLADARAGECRYKLSVSMLEVYNETIRDLLAPPLVSINHYPIERVVDIDGDGIDEFVYRSTYYEGEYFLLLKWDGKAWQVLTLGGDGA